MSTNSAVTHIECRSCGEEYDLDLTEYPCRNCGGILDPKYDYSEADVTPQDWESRSGSMWKYRELLPIRDEASIVSLGEGSTPLVECPSLADEIGVRRLLVKDEGQNPTNTFKDRGLSAAISGAKERGVNEVAIPSAGNAGHSASTYAARAGMNCHVYLNYQAGELKKDFVRLHGADLHLCKGKITEAGAKFNEERRENGWYSVATFQTPFRHEGKKTMGFEIFEDLDWSSPDHIVYPTGGGVGLIGIWKAYNELAELGWMDGGPSLNVAQSEGSAPVVRAIKEGKKKHEPWDNPQSIARGVEIPDPGASSWILEAVYKSGGTGIAVSDDDAVEAAIKMARKDGVEMCVTSAIALAGTLKLGREGAFGWDDEVVVINTGAGCKTADRLGNAVR